MKKEKQEEILKYLLERIHRSEKHKNQLDTRIKNIAAKLQTGENLDEDKLSSEKRWKPETESRILEQKKEIDQLIAKAMDILDCLPLNSLERQICELRHIDLKTWGAISTEIPISRSQANRRYKTALDKLLQNRRIKDIVAEHEEEYDNYIYELRGEKGKQGKGLKNSL